MPLGHSQVLVGCANIENYTSAHQYISRHGITKMALAYPRDKGALQHVRLQIFVLFFISYMCSVVLDLLCNVQCNCYNPLVVVFLGTSTAFFSLFFFCLSLFCFVLFCLILLEFVHRMSYTDVAVIFGEFCETFIGLSENLKNFPN